MLCLHSTDTLIIDLEVSMLLLGRRTESSCRFQLKIAAMMAMTIGLETVEISTPSRAKVMPTL